MKAHQCEHGIVDDVCLACTLPAVVLYAPHLGRDLRHILSHVPHAQVLTGERTVPGEAGCLEMHKQAIRMARMRGWRHVWVIEDDCLFTRHFDLRSWIDTCLAAFASGRDTVFGGTVRTHGARALWVDVSQSLGAQKASTLSDALIAVDKLCSAHCVAHDAPGFDAVLRCGQPYDLQLGEQGARCAVAWPFVAIQRPGLSGIGLPLDQGDSQRYAGSSVVDYTGLFEAQERVLQEQLGLQRRGAA